MVAAVTKTKRKCSVLLCILLASNGLDCEALNIPRDPAAVPVPISVYDLEPTSMTTRPTGGYYVKTPNGQILKVEELPVKGEPFYGWRAWWLGIESDPFQ